MLWTTEQIFFMQRHYKTRPYKIVQIRHRRKFNFNSFPKRSQILKLVMNFEAYSTFEDRKVTDSSPSDSSDHPGGVCTHCQHLCSPHSTVVSTERYIWSMYSRAHLDILLRINWITMTGKSSKHCAWHTEPLHCCFDLIRSHQLCIPWSPPLEIEPVTTECRAETLTLRYRSTSHTSYD